MKVSETELFTCTYITYKKTNEITGNEVEHRIFTHWQKIIINHFGKGRMKGRER